MKWRVALSAGAAILAFSVLASCNLILDAAVRAAGGAEKDITTFKFLATLNTAAGITADCAATIDGSSISVTVPNGTNVSALIATFASTGGSVLVGSVPQVSGNTVNDFTGPVSYTVRAVDGSTKTFIVVVTIALPSDKSITAFSFTSLAVSGTINEATKTITLLVPHGTDVTALVATFSTTGVGVTVGLTAQVSGDTANDFTNPVPYTVTAADSSSQTYSVVVTVNRWHLLDALTVSCGPPVRLAIDSAGVPYITYWPQPPATEYWVAKYESGSWQTVGTTGFLPNGPVSLAIDPAGAPHVAYKDEANSYKATVIKYEGGAWQTVGTGGVSAGAVDGPSLAFDSTGIPYLAYADLANSEKATVMRYASGSWQTVGAAGFSAGAAAYPSLVISGSGVPYVAFQDIVNGQKATVMKYAAGTWQTVGAAGFSDGTGYPITLAIDPSGIPYVAYPSNVMKYQGGSWQTVGSTDFITAKGNPVPIGIDLSGVPYIAYLDPTKSDKVTVKKYASGSWQMVGPAGFSTATSGYVDLAIDPSGTPYVSYRSYGDWRPTTMVFE
jgi:hypothetical protein